MRPYEVMIVLDPGLDDETVRSEVDRATDLIRARGGVPGRVDRWGRRRLAYEIADHREGYYVVVDASAEPAVMDELDRLLHLADHVLRHKVIRLPDRVVGMATRRPPRQEDAVVPPADLATPSPTDAQAASVDANPTVAVATDTADTPEAERTI